MLGSQQRASSWGLAGQRHDARRRSSAPAAGHAAAARAEQQQAAQPLPPLPPTKWDPDAKARHRRPPGWVAPGPPPAGPSSPPWPELQPGAEETLSYLTGDWRIFQLRDGHRWSMDDMLTALVALQEAAAAPPGSIADALDLGCGVGSVLLMVAWGLRRQHAERAAGRPAAPYAVRSLGVEAQGVSAALARRSVRYNLGPDGGGGGGGSVQVLHQDLRQPLPPGYLAQLITGSPPYVPEGSGGRSERPQKAPCCLETRGGVEDYCLAAAAALAPGGAFVVCAGLQGQPARFKGRRAQLAAAAAGLVVVRQVTVVTREGKPPLFAVYVMRRAADVPGQQQQQQQQQQRQRQQERQDPEAAAGLAAGFVEELFVARRANGRHTEQWHAAREVMGLPPLPGAGGGDESAAGFPTRE